MMINNVPQNLNKYSRQHAEHLIDDAYTFSSEFLHWPDQPELWSPPWAKIHVFVMCKDFSLSKNLLSDATLKKDHIDRETYWIGNLPKRLFRQLYKGRSERGEDLNYSRVTIKERDDLLVMATDDEAKEWSDTIERIIDRGCPFFEVTSSKERPIKVFLTGADDLSQAKTFSSRDEAIECLKLVKSDPTWETLSNVGFLGDW